MTAIARANNICMLTPVGNWEMRESFKTNRNSNAEMLTVAQKSKINFFLEAFEKLIVRWKMEELVNIAPKIRADIIEASINAYSIDHMNKIYNKASTLNSVINKDIGEDIIANYKRASNILDSELKNSDVELSNTTDPGIFKNDYEKNLFKKINEMRKYFTNINKDENYKESLTILADAKKVISDFFDNVKVNDEDKNIKKNRLELLQMLCRTFNNYINFSKIETK